MLYLFERRTSNPPSSNAWSIKWGIRGMLVSDGDKKPHLINCEAICVHEEEAKRIPNVCFTAE